MQLIGITCKKDGVFRLSKMESLLIFHIAQITVRTPPLISTKSYFGMPLSKLSNKLVIFLGGAKPKVM
jgi:hypothetical protein